MPRPLASSWRARARIGKSTDGDGNHVGKASVLQIDRGAAHRAETIRKDIAAVGFTLPLGRLPGDGDLLPTKARLIADYGTGTPLTLQAMAHGDATGSALDGEIELAAAAAGVAVGHGM